MEMSEDLKPARRDDGPWSRTSTWLSTWLVSVSPLGTLRISRGTLKATSTLFSPATNHHVETARARASSFRCRFRPANRNGPRRESGARIRDPFLPEEAPQDGTAPPAIRPPDDRLLKTVRSRFFRHHHGTASVSEAARRRRGDASPCLGFQRRRRVGQVDARGPRSGSRDDRRAVVVGGAQGEIASAAPGEHASSVFPCSTKSSSPDFRSRRNRRRCVPASRMRSALLVVDARTRSVLLPPRGAFDRSSRGPCDSLWKTTTRTTSRLRGSCHEPLERDHPGLLR
jgi:hypothetical protein